MLASCALLAMGCADPRPINPGAAVEIHHGRTHGGSYCADQCGGAIITIPVSQRHARPMLLHEWAHHVMHRAGDWTSQDRHRLAALLRTALADVDGEGFRTDPQTPSHWQ